jgi:hypothetical protein
VLSRDARYVGAAVRYVGLAAGHVGTDTRDTEADFGRIGPTFVQQRPESATRHVKYCEHIQSETDTSGN